MEYSINTAKNWSTTVSVTVTSDDVKAQYDKALKNVQKEVKIEGFRQGKVPPHLVQKWYGGKIESEANELCIEHAWKTVFEENDFHMINDPQIANFNPTDSGGMTFNIVFDVRPEFKVEGYEGMAVEKIIYDVTDEDVDHAINEARERNAMLYTIEDEAREGHFLFADFQEVDPSGVPMIGQKFENQQILLNKGNKELTPQLLGVKTGEVRRVALKVRRQQSEFVEQSGPVELDKIYQVSIKEIKERRVPDLDDELAKDLGPYETVQQLREQVEKNLKHQAEHDSEHAFESALSDALASKIDFEIPESMLSHYLDNIIADIKERNKNNPRPFDENQYREIYKNNAIWDLKWHLINEQLRLQENFTATEADIDAKLAHYLEHGEDGIKRAEAIRNNKKELQRLQDGIIFDKLYAFLADKATVTQVHKPWREAREHDESDDDTDDENVAADKAEF